VANPAGATAGGRIEVGGDASGLAAADSRAYMTAASRLHVFDVSEPTSAAVVVAIANTPGEDQGVAVVGGYAYVAADFSGLQVIDVSNPVAPAIVGSVDTPDRAMSVTVAGSYAFVADLESGLQIIDVTDPSSPEIVGNVSAGFYALDVAVVGPHAYVAYETGLVVIDVTNPLSPSIVGSVDTPSVAYSVVVAGSHAYVADGSSGLQVIDITNPASPAIVGSADTPGSAGDVAVSDTHAFISDGYSGLQVIDITDPTSPTIVGSVAAPYRFGTVAVADLYVYVADDDDRTDLQVIDITNPTLPRIVGNVDVCGNGVFVGDYIYVASSDLVILPTQCSAPTPVRLLSLSARPLRDGILLSWATSSESDVAGFHVYQSLDPKDDYVRLNTQLILPRSTYEFFDAEAEQGAIYYYRLEALDRSGNREFFGPVSARIEPRGGGGLRTMLGQSFPNPSRGGAITIPFTLAKAADVRIRILDSSGRQVRIIMDEAIGDGDHLVTWDGRNDRRDVVPAGIYVYQLLTPGFVASRRFVRLQ